ncbi:secretory immunoglobulin A-binding protein EsiB-like [Gigantopelta aegis]|uniref:secretory immunoglobulin A-binding protein EsiB-like n=1 Tax=Gigantopelta aegis TaxID=1735272 RepID=UPI001B888FD9|nr:secretory immunoglobulin A-binding protein EsiB-like [Gigantopelta aegis]
MATSGLEGASQAELRHRYQPELDPEWNPNLPYGGKVYLARKKKSDPMYVRVLEAGLIIFTFAMVYYAFFYFDNLHFHVVHAYAHLGYAHAQHQVGQRYLHGKGVEKHDDKAMEWFRKAADQGHAHASYNLAIGHLRGMNAGLKPGEAHTLIHHAASKGVEEADKVLNTICTQGGCD